MFDLRLNGPPLNFKMRHYTESHVWKGQAGHGRTPKSNWYDIRGVDFVFDADLNPYLIETNRRPVMLKNKWTWDAWASMYKIGHMGSG